MKKFTLEVSHASPAQLSTIALELKIMANGWERHGPRIMINGQRVKAPSYKRQAAKRPQSSDIKFYVKERSKSHRRRTKQAGQDALLFYKFTSD
jgi:hypothetical protein